MIETGQIRAACLVSDRTREGVGEHALQKKLVSARFRSAALVRMGCAASRVENEDTVRRCKERRRLMKDAVHARHHLALAHVDYLRSLLLTGSSLSRFASGEPFISVSDRTPPVIITSCSDPRERKPPTPSPSPIMLPERNRYLPPSPTISDYKMPPVVSAPTNPGPSRLASVARPTVPRSPSQLSSSSAWDWENFYPPSPPDSEFFDRRKAQLEEEEAKRQRLYNQHHHDEEEEYGENDWFGSRIEEERENIPSRPVGKNSYELPSTRSEQIHGSERGNNDNDEHENYRSSTASSEVFESRSEDQYGYIADRSDFAGSTVVPPTPDMSSSISGTLIVRKTKSELVPSLSSAVSAQGQETPEMRMMVRHHTLAEIAAAIDDYFIKAANAGERISELLEIGHAQVDRNSRQIKKTLYHSNSILGALMSSWSSKPPLAIRYSLDTSALGESGSEQRSHGSTLECLLAWEKKLFEEVKARESVKIELEKKLSVLRSQEYHGKDDLSLEKTKASIKKLQSLVIVTSQGVATTSTAIIRVRDNELAPQLLELCFALLDMWRSMNKFHEIQNTIVQQVRGLFNHTVSESTSDLQRMATRDLETAVSGWHSNFNRLVKYQRDYIRSLYSWLRLTLLQVTNDNQQKDRSSPISLQLAAFCDRWKQALDQLPDTVASESIKSFVNVVNVIYTKQMEELKIKKKTEISSKELDKKLSSLRSLERKYYQSYSTVGLVLPGNGHAINGQVQGFDARDPLSNKKSEITLYRRKVEDEMNRYTKAIEVTRSITLNNIQTGLPGVFHAMTGFSGLFAEALESVCHRAGSVQ